MFSCKLSSFPVQQSTEYQVDQVDLIHRIHKNRYKEKNPKPFVC